MQFDFDSSAIESVENKVQNFKKSVSPKVQRGSIKAQPKPIRKISEGTASFGHENHSDLSHGSGSNELGDQILSNSLAAVGNIRNSFKENTLSDNSFASSLGDKSLAA